MTLYEVKWVDDYCERKRLMADDFVRSEVIG